jgi:hypothetical protein
MSIAHATAHRAATPPCPSWCNGDHSISLNGGQDAVHETVLHAVAEEGRQVTEFQVLAEQYPVAGEVLRHVYVNRRDARGRYRAELSLTMAEARTLATALSTVLGSVGEYDH